MAIDPEFGRRLRTAKREWERRHDSDLSNQQLADRVAQAAGIDGLAGQTVSAWLNKGQEPSSLALLRAVAEVLEVGVGYLAGVPERIAETLVEGERQDSDPPIPARVKQGRAGAPITSKSAAAAKKRRA